MSSRRLVLALPGALLAGGLLFAAVAFSPAAATSSGPQVRVPLLARDGSFPTPPPRTPYPVLLPCGDILAPVDKQHELAPDCVPPDLVELPPGLAIGPQSLRAETAAAFEQLAAAAGRDGYSLATDSAYRSYATQEETFSQWVALLGLETAERTSARPGHSEHQLGTTVDLCASSACLDAFSGSPEASWVAWHAWEFGFVVSYPDEKEAVTGYAGEPWHIRYVGLAVALGVRNTGLTLHEYLLR